MDIEKLEQTVESVGCTLHKSTIAGVITSCCIMLPDSFPWYGADVSEIKRRNSRIVARVEIHSHSCKWKTWSKPVINVCVNGLLGIEMHENDSRDALLLKNSSYEQIAAWLVEKIGEVSAKAKELRKLMITRQSKEYEA